MRAVQYQLLLDNVHIVLYIAIYLLHSTGGNVGDGCEQGCGAGEECVDNICLCDAVHELQVDFIFGVTCQAVYMSPCNNMLCQNTSNCSIDDQLLNVYGNCRKVKLQNVSERCYDNTRDTLGVVHICDFTKHQRCKLGQCVCNKNYWYDPELKTCDLKANYLAENNISEYRVKPGVYCADHDDCISGLQCSNLTCACPKECKYLEETEVCDCGSSTSLAGPIAVGVIGGIIIIIFWFRKIRHTVRTYFQNKKNSPMTIMMNATTVTTHSTDTPLSVCDTQVSTLPPEEKPPTYEEAMLDRPTRVST